MSLENTPAARISALAAAQKTYFRSGATLPEAFRRTMLRRLDAALANWEKRLCDALWTDLHKSPEEAFLTEISIVRGEDPQPLRPPRQMDAPRTAPHAAQAPAVEKPDRLRTTRAGAHRRTVELPRAAAAQPAGRGHLGGLHRAAETFALYAPRREDDRGADLGDFRRTVRRRRAGRPGGQHPIVRHALGRDLLHGKPRAGTDRDGRRGENLTPVVLELGGKSPCIVDRGADIEVAARRLAWGKTLNAGQTCIAPDYLLIHRPLQEPFTEAFARALQRLHGDDAQQSPCYVRLVNDRAFERVTSYLAQGKILVGGRTDAADRYIEPTLLAEVDPASPVMQEEIFGPVLPMLPFDDIGEARGAGQRPRKTVGALLLRTRKGGPRDPAAHLFGRRVSQ